MSRTQQTGKLGEDYTADYLERQGYTLLSRNYRGSGGEIDLIAQGGGYLLFVEVKTRGKRSLYAPAYAITPRKRGYLTRTAQQYLAQHSLDLQPRFDAALVVVEKGRVVSFDYLENVFWRETATGGGTL